MRRTIHLAVAYAVVSFVCTGLAAEGKQNLLPEGASFEVGMDGFSLNNYYLISHHGREIKPVFDDSTAAHGKYSLRLDNPLGDKIVIAYRPIRLLKDTQVTVSGYVKGEGAVTVQLKRWQWETAAKQDVVLTDRWQRFNFRGRIKSDQVYFLWILPTVKTRRIWLDALQIEEGELSEFHPKPLDFSLTTTAFCNTYQIGEDCALIARLYAEDPPANITVNIRVLDLFRREVLSKAIQTQTRGEQRLQMTIPLFQADKRGSYKVVAEARLGDHVERDVFTFGVLKPVTKPDPFFGFQVKHIFNDDAERRFADNNEQRELVYANVDLRYVNRLARLVGAYSIRCFRTAEWRKLELPSGGYVWRDLFVKLLSEDGLRDPLVILRIACPEWDRDSKQQGKRGKSLPRMDAWQDYVRQIVRHYRGKVRSYEIVNEPETKFPTPELYVQYLKAAHDVIRDEDPDARIVAPSYSGRRPFSWLERFGKAGGVKLVDVAAIHYAGRTLPEQGMDEETYTWDLLRRYRDILTRFNGGRELPLWDTEGGSFYWIPEYDPWPTPEQPLRRAEHWIVRDESLAAAYAARLQLIEKARGVERLYSFELGFYYSQNASKARDLASMYVNFDGSPSAPLVTYNAVADIFGWAEPVALLPLSHHVVATVFEKGGRTVAAVWKGAPIGEISGFEKYDPPVYVDVAIPAHRLSAMNLLGHPVQPEARAEGVRLVATAFPTYFTSEIPPSDIVDALKAAKLTLGRRPNISAAYEELVRERYYSAALALCQEKLTDSPRDVRNLVRAGQMLIRRRRFNDAMTYLEKALALDPGSPEANYAMGRCIYRLTQAKKFNWFDGLRRAVPYLAKAVEGLPDELELRYLLWYCAAPSDPALALAQIDPAVKINPGNFRTKRMVGSREKLLRASQKRSREK